jgi:hypothetical protein
MGSMGDIFPSNIFIEADHMIPNLTSGPGFTSKHRLGVAALITLLLPVVGCGKGGEDTGSTGDTTGTLTDTYDTGTVVGGYVEGTITSPAGDVVNEARVTLCAEFCRVAISGEDGSYRFDGVVEDDFAFDVAVPGEHWPTILFPLSLGFESETVVDLQMQELGDEHVIPDTAAELALLPSITVTIGFDNIDTGFTDPETAAASHPSVWAWESLVDLSGTIAGVWYLEPWEVKAVGGALQFKVANEWGWSAGSAVAGVVASYDDKGWLDVGDLVVSDDGQWVTSLAGESGLPILSTLVIFEQ